MSAANFECDCVSCNMEVVLGLCPGYVGLNVWQNSRVLTSGRAGEAQEDLKVVLDERGWWYI